MLATAAAHDERDPLSLRPRPVRQLAHLPDERGRQVVDHEPPEVLERVGRGRTPRARQPRDDEELTHSPSIVTPGPPSRRAETSASGWWRPRRTRRPGRGSPAG